MQASLFQSPATGVPLTLRPYQGETVRAIYAFLQAREDNPCAVIPTAGGKTPIIARICRDVARDWGGRALVLQPSKELIEQTAAELQQCCPEVPVGVNSASIGRRDTDELIVVAGIHSVYKRACDLGRFNIIIPDEAHLIPPDGEGMYRQFFADSKLINPHVRVCGLTATPFRLSSGPICSADGILNEICYEVGVRELIVGGYISRLRTPKVKSRVDISGVHVRGGEYIAGELERAFDDDATVREACAELLASTADRKSVLIFTAGIRHGEHVARVIEEMSGQRCGFVCGETPDGERERQLERFKSGELKYLANVNILTTGYNCRRVDCVVLLRSTLSPGLYYQMVGRGFRLSPETDKTDCLVLDFGDNILTHGPVDMLRIPGEKSQRAEDGAPPAKECPKCHELISAGFSRCPWCGYEFPPPDVDRHGAKATQGGILSDDIEPIEYTVLDIAYAVHVGKSGIPLMRVDYYYGRGSYDRVTDWICVEHEGYARDKAVAWWRQRSPDQTPVTAQAAVNAANMGALAITDKVTVKLIPGKKWPEIVGYDIGEIPEPLNAADVELPELEATGFDEWGQPLPAKTYQEEEIPF